MYCPFPWVVLHSKTGKKYYNGEDESFVCRPTAKSVSRMSNHKIPVYGRIKKDCWIVKWLSNIWRNALRKMLIQRSFACFSEMWKWRLVNGSLRNEQRNTQVKVIAGTDHKLLCNMSSSSKWNTEYSLPLYLTFRSLGERFVRNYHAVHLYMHYINNQHKLEECI